MAIIIINGSPRKNFSTARLCARFADGVRDVCPDMETAFVHLYDFSYSGCRSCFACKDIHSRHYGNCAFRDDLTPLLSAIGKADGLVIASPLYFGTLPGQVQAFIERLLFPRSTYETGYRPCSPLRIPVQTLYTMNATEAQAAEAGFIARLDATDAFLGHVFTPPERIVSFNTYQFRDYSRYRVEVFSEAEKRQYRTNVFPQDLQRAFEAGRKMAGICKMKVPHDSSAMV